MSVTNPNDTKTLHTPLVQFLFELMSLIATDAITVPRDYREQALSVRKALRNDNTGLVNSVLDFAIKAALVEYTVQTDNPNLTRVLNEWLSTVNSELRGKIPTGIRPLAKQYFDERWKGSSLCLLRTAWEDVDFGNGVGSLSVPTKMWFVKGEDIFVEQDEKVVIGEEKYSIIIGKNYATDPKDRLPLRTNVNEAIFIQKPFARWTDQYPVPFIVNRGLYENMLFLDLLSNKGQKIISKAIEYLLVMKKGTENLAKLGKPEFIYSEDDLKKVKQDLSDKIVGDVTSKGTPIYATNFDTDMEHFIPDYSKAVSAALYSPVEKKILAGLGLVEVVEGTASSRKESILNPRPFMAEVAAGVEDFKQLLTDVMLEVIERNKNRTKYSNREIKIYSSTSKEFVDDNVREHLRSAFDRGVLSYQTYVETVCNGNFMQEKERNKQEKKDNLQDVFYPHLVQNLENIPDANTPAGKKAAAASPAAQKKGKVPAKSGPEAKNFKAAVIMGAVCNLCSHEFDYQNTPEAAMGGTECPNCHKMLTDKDITFPYTYEQAPYQTNADLPKTVQVLPSHAKTIWKDTFNSVYADKQDDLTARKIAWSAVKKVYKKTKDGWVKK